MTNAISAENEGGRLRFGWKGTSGENQTEEDGAALHCSIAFVWLLNVGDTGAGWDSGLLRSSFMTGRY